MPVIVNNKIGCNRIPMAGWTLCKVNPDTDCVSNGRLLGRTTDCFDNNREIRMVELRVDADFMEHYVKIKFE